MGEIYARLFFDISASKVSHAIFQHLRPAAKSGGWLCGVIPQWIATLVGGGDA